MTTFHHHFKKSGLQFLAVAMGLFVAFNPARIGPIASFWQQWLCSVAFLMWLAAMPKNAAPSSNGQSVAVGANFVWVAFAALTGLQFILGRNHFPLSIGLFVGLMSLAFAVGAQTQAWAQRCLTSDGEMNAAPHQITQVLRGWTAGLTAAVMLNGVVVALNEMGFQPTWASLWHITPPDRVFGSVGQANQFGVLIVLAMCALWWEKERRGKLTLAVGACWLLCAALLALTHSRAAWIAAFAVGGLQFVCAVGWRNATRRFWGEWCSLWGVVLVAAMVRQWSLTQMTVEQRATSYPLRWNLLSDAWALFTLHPILGVGYQNFGGARLFELNTPLTSLSADHAHNLYFQLAAEWGSIGLALGLAATLYIVFVAMRSFGQRITLKRDIWLFTWSSVLVIFIYSQTEFPLWYTFFLLPTAWLIGMGQALASRSGLITQRDLAQWPRKLISLVAMGVLVLLALDYTRLESLFLRTQTMQATMRHREVLPLDKTMDVLKATAFPTYAHHFALVSLGPDRMLVKDKLEYAEDYVRLMPSVDGIAMYATLLHLDAQTNRAIQLLESVSMRNPDAGNDIREVLSSLPKGYAEPLLNAAPSTTSSFDTMR